jgi:hypothetical protein
MANRNVFTLGSQIGGPDAAVAIQREEQQLRDAMNQWTGDYCREIREFAFLLRVDGQFHTYTQEWNIQGAQKAKRKKDWIEVEIGIPESWWRGDQGRQYKEHLIQEIEKGLHSMIEVLRKNRHSVHAEALLADWEKIKSDYLSQSSVSVDDPPDPMLTKALASIKELTSVLGIQKKWKNESGTNPILKLYKDNHYWEAWQTSGRITIHWGEIGDQGNVREINLSPSDNASSIIMAEAAQRRTEGYRAIEDDRLRRITIQYPIIEMGTTTDLDKRHEVEALMNQRLGWTGLGRCDGGDIGNGTMNVFCSVVDADKAEQVITKELETHNLLTEAKIILVSEEDDEQLLFPKDSLKHVQ